MINVTLSGADEIGRALDALDSSKARKKIMRKVGRLVINKTKKRGTRQLSPEGEKWQKHWKNRKRKMLVRLIKRLVIKDLTDKSATVTFRNSFEGAIGYTHQFGATQTMSKSKLKKIPAKKRRRGKDPATYEQAMALIGEGFKRRGKTGKRKTSEASLINYIIATHTQDKAGYVLRLMRNTAPSETWQTTQPARPFLGVSDDDLKEIATLALAQIEAEWRAA
jgi:phage virion morphogenesis protein